MKYNVFFDLIKLFAKGEIDYERNYNIKSLVINFFFFFFFSFVLNIISFFFIYILVDELPSLNLDTSLPYEIIFVAPFTEEIIFRLLLKKNNKNIALWIVFLFLFLLMKFNIVDEKIIYLTFIILFMFIVFFTIKDKTYESINLVSNKRRHTLLLIVTSSFLFGLAHISNLYSLDAGLIFIIIYFFSHFIVGLLLSVIRMKYGILISILYHSALNGIIYLLSNLS